MPNPKILDHMAFKRDNSVDTYLISGSVVKGYLKAADGKFYKESTYTTVIDGHDGLFYIALDTNYIYRYDETNRRYIQMGGNAYIEGEGISIENNEISAKVDNTTIGFNANHQLETKGLGTAAGKNFTTYVSPNNPDLPIAASIYSAITSAAEGIYHPDGVVTCSELTSNLLIQANVGHTYRISDSGTTTDLFLVGPGHDIHENDTAIVVFAGASSGFKFDLRSGSIDLSAYQTKELETPIEIDGVEKQNVEDALNALNTLSGNNKTALDDKEDVIFEGTRAQWTALPAVDKAKYSLVILTDDADYVGNITNNITNGDPSAVSSSAVYDMTKLVPITIENVSDYGTISTNISHAYRIGNLLCCTISIIGSSGGTVKAKFPTVRFAYDSYGMAGTARNTGTGATTPVITTAISSSAILNADLPSGYNELRITFTIPLQSYTE